MLPASSYHEVIGMTHLIHVLLLGQAALCGDEGRKKHFYGVLWGQKFVLSL